MTNSIAVELCASSVESLLIAATIGVTRVELCQDLDQGGLTPSPGLFQLAKDLGVETHVLIRPRAGGFCYSVDEKKVMLNDVSYFRENGAAGITIGALQENFELDGLFLKEVKSISGIMPLTFHRAIDESIDWKRSMDELMELGYHRILSSGFCSNVDAGFPMLKQMISFAKGIIEVMPGGGVNINNVRRLITEANATSIHFSGTTKVLLDEESAFSETILRVDEKKVKRLMEVIRSLG
jgi:copper homeostasis protein